MYIVYCILYIVLYWKSRVISVTHYACTELTHCLLSEHAHAFQSQHLDLTVARMMEQQGVIQTLYQKVKDLEDKAEDTESYKKRINKVLLVLQQDIRILNGGK